MNRPKRYQFAAACIVLCAMCACGNKDYSKIIAVTGATPLAVAVDAPADIQLTVKGLVKREYTFSGEALRALATTRIRTREISPEGKFQGTYIYVGIPVYNLLEGIAPEKPKDAVYDRPLDMYVTFTSSSGKKSRFSYGELTMTDDSLPVTLAFDRKQLLPSKDPEKYEKNMHKDNLKGLRIICPREFDTARYCDDVVSVMLSVPETPDSLLPKMTKGVKCSSAALKCVADGKENAAVFSGIPVIDSGKWVRVGHGRGYKGVSHAAGYDIRAFLKKNFPGCGPDSFFMFIACDGYRSIFSGREIFSTEDGESCMIVNKMDGKEPRGGIMLASIRDYFVDRNIWGLSHIVLIEK